MEADLALFLDRAAGWRVKYGTRDCLLLIADWWLEVTGDDPAAPWRGRYSTPAGAARIIRKHGGELGLLRHGLGLVGARSVPPPDAQAGDVGLVERMTTDGMAKVGAICTGNGWATLDEGGLGVGPAGVFAVWRPAYA